MADGEARSAEEIASVAGVDARYLQELLSANAANGYVNYNAESEQFYLTPEQIAVFATEDSPANMHGLLQIIVAQYAEHETAVDVFRTGKGRPLGRPAHMPVLWYRSLLPSGLHFQPGNELDHCAGWRFRKSLKRVAR